jgi:hypothetical protein
MSMYFEWVDEGQRVCEVGFMGWTGGVPGRMERGGVVGQALGRGSKDG